jgi:hypothetical protein
LGGGFSITIPSSPGTEKNWGIENRLKSGFYHPGAFCMRSKPKDVGITYLEDKKPVSEKSASQCCYDASGNLFTSGPVAGTADKGHAGGNKHKEWDVDPFSLANACDGGCADECFKRYYEVRPTVGAEKCENNPSRNPWPCPENHCSDCKGL